MSDGGQRRCEKPEQVSQGRALDGRPALSGPGYLTGFKFGVRPANLGVSGVRWLLVSGSGEMCGIYRPMFNLGIACALVHLLSGT